MSRIDYSKWDNLEVSDSDEEESNTPRVTKLDRPSRITTLSDGSVLIQETHQSAPATSRVDEKTSPTTAATTNKIPSAWTDKGGTTTIFTDNNNDTNDVYWSQDRYTVTIPIAIYNAAIRSVHVKGMLPYADGHCATGSTPACLVVQRQDENGTVWWQDDLPHFVHGSQNEEDEVDWSVERLSDKKRFLTIVLYKAVPCEGLTLWWKRPFMQCPEIDLSAWRPTGGSSQAFQHAWEEAHKQFQANVQTKQPRDKKHL